MGLVGSAILKHQAYYSLLVWGPDLRKVEQMLGFS